MQDEPKNSSQHQDQDMLEEAEQAQHQDHRHDPNLRTPENLQHGNYFRPEGE